MSGAEDADVRKSESNPLDAELAGRVCLDSKVLDERTTGCIVIVLNDEGNHVGLFEAVDGRGWTVCVKSACARGRVRVMTV